MLINRKDQINRILDRLLKFAVCYTVFSIPVSITMTNISMLVVLVVFLLRKALVREPLIRTSSTFWVLLVFLAVSLASIAGSTAVLSSLRGIVKYLKYFTLFLVLTDTVRDEKTLKAVAAGALAGLLLVSVDGVFQYITGRDFLRGFPLPYSADYLFDGTFPRIKASMHNPNDLASYLVAVLPLAVCMALYFPAKKIRGLMVLAALPAFFVIFNTFSRGAAFGVAAALILFSLARKDVKPVLLMVIAVLFFMAFAPPQILEWSAGRLNLYDLLVEEGGRRMHWQTAVNMIKAHPLLGVGINTFSLNYSAYSPPGDTFGGWYAHNSYLQIAAETGLTGLAAFFLIAGDVMRRFFRGYAAMKDDSARVISLGFLGGAVGFMTAAIFESALQHSNLAVLFWYLMGILAAVYVISEETNEV